jgi:WD40 repeat protein
MERLWEVERQQRSTMLRAATLDQLGGAAQIVAAHLERAMATLTPAQQAVASALFRQLVTPSGAKIAHAAPDLAGYAGVSEDEALAVLEALAARRILRPGDDGSYEIYHDVLAAPILAWRARFVQAQALVVAHQRSRRLALVAAVAVAAVVAMALVTVFALVQRSNARSDAQAAHARELDASAVALVATDPELGLLLARDSALLSPSASAEAVLRDGLLTSRVRTRVAVGRPLLAAAAVDEAIVTAAADGSVLVAGPAGARRTTASGRPAIDASIAHEGDVLLTGGDGRLRIVSGGTVRMVPKIEHARGADISSSAQLAAVRSIGSGHEPDRRVRVVDLGAGETVLEVDHGAPATAAALSAAGDLLATGGTDHVVRLWHVPDGRLLQVYGGHVGPITTIEFSTRGTLLATGATDGIGRVWRTGDGRPVTVLSGHTNYLTDIGFSADGKRVVTASLDGTARTWKAKTGAALAICADATDAMASASYRSKGEIVTASLDGIARTWDVVVQPALPVVADLHAPVSRLDFVADGDALSATAGGRAYRIPLPRGPAGDVGPAAVSGAGVVGPGGLRAVPHGKTVTVKRGDGTTFELVGHKDDVTSVAFSPDGTKIVTASVDHDARIWDARDGAPRQLLRGHFAVVSGARFSPDGRWVATAGPEAAGLWSAASGSLVYRLQGHTGKLLSVAFSPDSRRLATGGFDGTVRLWPCRICGGIDELVKIANARLARTGRAATDEERRRYGI